MQNDYCYFLVSADEKTHTLFVVDSNKNDRGGGVEHGQSGASAQRLISVLQLLNLRRKAFLKRRDSLGAVTRFYRNLTAAFSIIRRKN